MRYLPKLQQLQAFQSVILHGSISAAAKALEQSQPGITRSLRELEQILGTPLLIRGGGGVMPTEAGRLFNARIELVLNELERALDELEQFNHSNSGTVVMGVSSLSLFTVYPEAVKKFRRKHPKSNITNMEGQVSELLPALRTGKLDFIMGVDIPSDYLSGIVLEPLFKTSYAIYVRKGHQLANCTSLEELKGADWFLPVTTMGHKNNIDSLLSEFINRQCKTVMRGTGSAAIQMALHADYLTIATESLARSHFLAQNFCTIPVKEPLPKAEFSLIYSSERPLTSAARCLMDEFRRECQNYKWD
ncbi:LysR substrate-binding domain-containing protein [Serratia aquatilis]|uniref:LysR substrate-binding domain-containing protein n=1 Tax=Serratia aquatilis TaxID=1737515 RepID=A0ABV6EC35_9GAMM